MSTNLPNNINEAIKILAYNDWPWLPATSGSDHIVPHPKDKATVTSLAEAQYPWTERQGKLAVIILKRYLTKFEAFGMDIKALLTNPVFKQPFRIISNEKIIEVVQEENREEFIELKFPYNKKIVELIRVLKGCKGLPQDYFVYDGETKKWSIKKTDVTTYYCTLIAGRYNFTFVSESLLDEVDDIKKEKIKFKKPYATIEDEQIVFKNTSESLVNYWQKNLADKRLLLQVDSLKNLALNQDYINVKAETEIGDKIAHNNKSILWIDKKSYSKHDIISGLKELDSFPICMTISGDITNDRNEIQDAWEWFTAFKQHGYEYKNFAWGCTLKEPRQLKDYNEDEKFMHSISDTMKLNDKDYFQAFELYQMSNQFKFIDDNTKVLFIRNKIPRSFLRSKIKPRAAVIGIGGGYYAAGGEYMKRFLDNLPKKLYYSDVQPSTWETQGRTVIKL